MLDRIEFEQNLEKVRAEQAEQMTEYLSSYLKKSSDVKNMQIIPEVDRKTLDEIVSIPIPRKGRDPKEVGDELVSKVLDNSLHLQHPKFFSFVVGGMSPYSLAGSILSDIYNVNTCGFSLSPGAALIEEKMIKWMGSRAGYDENCGGVFTSGGSLSNLTGFLAARKAKLSEDDYPFGCAYLSDQAHSSVKKGIGLMGVLKKNIRIIPTDEDFRMDTVLLEQAIKDDIKAGKKPFLVVGSIGTTNTGSIDPLDKIAEIKEKYGLWFHIDGAYGGSVLFSDIYNHLAKGVELSDSLSWDTHKWAMQVYSCSCIIARDKKTLLNAFVEHPEYLTDVIDAEHTDGWDLGIEMSRPARAIKLWYTVQAMGTDLLSDVIDYAFFKANTAKRALLDHSGWEITSKPMCGTLTFRYAPQEVDVDQYDELNKLISQKIIKDRYAYVVTTTIKNKRVLRFNLISNNSTDKDVVETVEYLDNTAKELAKAFVK